MMITLSALDGNPGIRHAFFTRQGGVSRGLFDSLNCGFGSRDDPARVEENRAIAAAQLALPVERLVTCHQIHGTAIVTVERPWPRAANPRADGMVTAVPGIALGVLAADCAPVLFADPEARVIGAAHAGWRGAVHGIVDATVEAMTRQGARRERLRAVIGPCIGGASYEVGAEFRERFLADGASNADLFQAASRSGHFLFDLPAYVLRRLERLGVRHAAATGGDTVAEPARFFSYRRACLEQDRCY